MPQGGMFASLYDTMAWPEVMDSCFHSGFGPTLGVSGTLQRRRY